MTYMLAFTIALQVTLILAALAIAETAFRPVPCYTVQRKPLTRMTLREYQEGNRNAGIVGQPAGRTVPQVPRPPVGTMVHMVAQRLAVQAVPRAVLQRMRRATVRV